MAHGVCPWFIGYLLASPIRRLIQKPEEILSPHLKEGMKVLEIGPGMGFFSIPMAIMVGEKGKVVCVDLQDKMINGVKKRAKKAGVLGRINARVCPADTLQILDLAGTIDIVVLFAVIHEMPDQRRLFE